MKWLLTLIACAGLYAQTRVPVKLQVQLGHTEWITSVALSPDGRYVVTGSNDKTARLWEVVTGAEVLRFDKHSAAINSVAFSPDGRHVVTGSNDKTARLWEVATGAEVLRFDKHSSAINSVVFSSDGRYVVTGSDDKTARLWEALTGEEISRFEHQWGVTSVAISPDASHVLAAASHLAICLWDVATGEEVRRFNGHSNRIMSVAFSPSGHFVLTGSRDMTARLWSVSTGAEVRRFNGHGGFVQAVAFSTNGRHALTGGNDGIVRLWEVSTGKEVHHTDSDPLGVSSVALSTDGRWALSGSGKGVRLWDFATGSEVRRFGGQLSAVHRVAFSPDGRFLLMGSHDHVARLWDTETGAESVRFAGHSGMVFPVAFSPDGQQIATGSQDKTARLWDTRTGTEMLRFEGHTSDVSGIVFSSDSRLLLTGSHDNSARVWDAETGVRLQHFEGNSLGVYSVAFSPDGKWILTGDGDSTARLWDATTGTMLHRFEGHTNGVLSAVFSPDGRRVLTGGGDGTARLWDATTRALLLRFEGHADAVYSAAFSPNGRWVLTGSADRSARLWDATTGALLRRFEGHTHVVYSAAFSPDGRWVLTGSEDGSARLWEASDAALRATLLSFKGGWAAVDPEGRYDAKDPWNVPGFFIFAGDDQVVELSQLKDRFHEEGLLRKIFAGEKLTTKASLLNDAYLPPKSTVISVDEKAQTARVRLESVRDGGYGEVLIRVDGQEVPGAVPQRLRLDPKIPLHEITVDLRNARLSPDGTSKVQVIAKGFKNSIASRLGAGGSVMEFRTEARQRQKPRLIALLVGITQYANPNLGLRWANKDVNDMETAIRIVAEGNLYEAVIVHKIATGGAKPPTRENIQSAMDNISKQIRADDVLLLVLAGHGTAKKSGEEDEEYYFLTADAQTASTSDLDLLERTSITARQLREWLIQPGMPDKKVLILDTCAAGAAAGQLAKLASIRELPSEEVRIMDRLRSRSGAWVLMASSPTGEAYEASLFENGLLTYALLQGLKAVPLGDGDSSVEVSKWFGFADKEIETLAKSIGARQKPRISAPDSQSFPIGVVNGERRARIPLSRRVPVLLRASVGPKGERRDTLGLGRELNERFLQIRYVNTGGDEAKGALPLVYVPNSDDNEDDVPEAIRAYVDYWLEGQEIVAEVRLRTRKDYWRSATLRGPRASFPATVAEWIQQQLEQWK